MRESAVAQKVASGLSLMAVVAFYTKFENADPFVFYIGEIMAFAILFAALRDEYVK